MKRLVKIACLTALVLLVNGNVRADRGVGKRAKVRTNLNVNMPSGSLRGSLGLNLKSGLQYRGSFGGGRQEVHQQALVTFQKGNTTYLIPFKSKITVPEIRQGYSGVKLIIRSPK